VFKIAMNLCVDFHRKRRVPTVSLSRPEGEEHGEETRDVEDLSPGPDANYEEREAEGRMDRIIRSLPAHYREVILLRHKNQFSYEEIADILSLPIGTVKARLHRAHLLLRSKLAPGGA
jgi:RNA polymerase sigma-70 factor (ECF subfamily)